MGQTLPHLDEMEEAMTQFECEKLTLLALAHLARAEVQFAKYRFSHQSDLLTEADALAVLSEAAKPVECSADLSEGVLTITCSLEAEYREELAKRQALALSLMMRGPLLKLRHDSLIRLEIGSHVADLPVTDYLRWRSEYSLALSHAFGVNPHAELVSIRLIRTESDPRVVRSIP